MKTLCHTLWAALALAASGGLASAAVEIELYGTVTRIDNPAGYSVSTFSVGDTLSGYVRYNDQASTTRTGTLDDGTPWAAYDDAIDAVLFQVSGYTLTSSGVVNPSSPNPGNAVWTENADPGAGADYLGFVLYGSSAINQSLNAWGPLQGAEVEGLIPTALWLGFEDSSGIVFGDGEFDLPSQPIDLEDFDAGEGRQNMMRFYPSNVGSDWQDKWFDVHFELSSRPVPEVASSLVWASLLACAAGSPWRRRYGTARPKVV